MVSPSLVVGPRSLIKHIHVVVDDGTDARPGLGNEPLRSRSHGGCQGVGDLGIFVAEQRFLNCEVFGAPAPVILKSLDIFILQSFISNSNCRSERLQKNLTEDLTET